MMYNNDPDYAKYIQLIETVWRQYTKPSLVQLTARSLFGAKLSSESMMTYYQVDHRNHMPMINH